VTVGADGKPRVYGAFRAQRASANSPSPSPAADPVAATHRSRSDRRLGERASWPSLQQDVRGPRRPPTPPEVTMPARPKAVLGRRPPPLSLGRWGARRVATGRGAVAPSPLGRGGGGGPRRGFGGRRLVAPLTSAAALERRDGGDGTAGSQEPPAASSRRSRRTLPSSLRSSARRAGARSGRPIASPAACSRRREEWGAASKAARSRACDSPAVRLTVAVLYPCWACVLLESLVALAPAVSARRTARRGDR